MFRKEASERPSEQRRQRGKERIKKTLKSQNRHVSERAEAEWTLFEEVLKAQ